MAEPGFLGERRLNLEGLDSRVRRIVLSTYVVLLALAIGVVVAERLPGYDIVTYVGVGLRSTNVAIAAFPLSVAVAMLLAGAAHARTRWRFLLLGLIAIALGMAALTGPSVFWRDPAVIGNLATRALPLPFIVACFIIARVGPRLRTAATFGISLALCLAFTAAVIGVTIMRAAPYGATVVFFFAGIAALALEPALLVVGFDLAEVSAEAARLVVRSDDGRSLRASILRWSLIVAGVAGAVSLQFGLGYTRPAGWYVLAIWICLLGLAAAAVGWIWIRRPSFTKRLHSEIGYLLVLLVAFVVAFGGLSFDEPQPGYTNFAGIRPFSLRVPSGLTQRSSTLPDTLRARTPASVMFATDGKPPSLTVVGWAHSFPGFAAEPPSNVNDLVGLTTALPMPLELGAVDKDGWARGEATAKSKKGVGFHFVVLRWDFVSPNVEYDTSWYLVCGGRANETDRINAMCEEARNSFAPRLTTRSSRPAAFALSLLYVVGAAGAVVLAWRRSRRGETPVLDFAAWVLFLTSLRWMGGYLFDGVNHPLDNLHFAAQLMSALVAVAAIAVGCASVWPADRAPGFDLPAARRLASQALAHLLIIAGLFFVYVFAIGRSEDSQVVRGVIVMLALTWELATAGHSLNSANEHSRFPHGSRVLIFSGYLILIATCVFLLGPSQMNNGLRIAAYDTESVVANGLVILGGALAVSRALGGLRALRHAPDPKASDGRSPSLSDGLDAPHDAAAPPST